MKFFFTSVFIFSALVHVRGYEPKYPVSAIPEELKVNVNAVFRLDKMVFKIHSKNKATHYVHKVITILNERGKQYASEVVFYDKLRKIRDFNGTVYDGMGKQINKLKNSEILDQSVYDGGLFNDDRLKKIDLSQSVYPYTVEIEYEVEYKFLFIIPGFSVDGEKVSSEFASYALEFPPDLTPRYKVLNSDVKPSSQKTSDGLESLVWEFKNIKPIKFEPFGPAKIDIVVSVIAAPSHFQYDAYVGTMNTWDEFGRWISSLNKGRNVLPAGTIQKIKELTQNLHTNEEKVKALYQFLQNKTRYVSIQLGIGGYQPFEASVVDNTGYGDCKALSNYMVSMLETIGIKSNYVLIDSEKYEDQMITDFPSSQFDHAIVAVPNGADTLWLECTSQTNPFGYQGYHTGDRKALLITEDGAKIVNTIQYSADQNLQSRVAEVKVYSNGDGKASVTTTYSGLQYENGKLHHVLNMQYDDQKNWLMQNTEVPTFDINSFSMINNQGKIPSAKVKADLTLKRLATVSGKRIFLMPNLMNRLGYIPEKIEGRKTKVVTLTNYTDIDTIHFSLPEGIYPEFLPEPVKLRSRFGEYSATFTLDQGSLLYVRKVKMLKGEFPPESYPELMDFYKGITKSDNIKVVFLSKT